MAYAEKIESYGDTNWYLVDRKPYRCPSCNSRNIGKAILGYPSEEDFMDESLYIIGCIPDPTPTQCKFGCNDCDSKFWKDTPRMRTHVKEMQKWREQQWSSLTNILRWIKKLFLLKNYLVSGLVEEYRIKINIFALSPNSAVKVFQQKYPEAKDVYVIQNLFKRKI